MMRSFWVLSALLLTFRAFSTPAPQLATPPAGAEHFSIVSRAGKHGESTRWTTADGRHHARESISMRGIVTEVDSDLQVGADGMLRQLTVRGVTPQGDAAESFAIEGNTAHWHSSVDEGSAPYTTPAMYNAFGGPIDVTAFLVEALLQAPDRTLALLPSGRAHADRLTTTVVGVGPAKRRTTLYAITGLGNTPVAVWVDAQGHFFAFIDAPSYVLAGYEGAEPQLEKAQDDALATLSPGLVKKLVRVPTGAVAFTHVRAFVQGARFLEDQTVVVDKGVITQVGTASDVVPPTGAQVIDGNAKTLVPGLWDAHQHVAGDASGPLLLSLGITSVRDPGNSNELTLARAARRARGDLLIPHVYPSFLIDGESAASAQGATVVKSLEEALSAVRRAKAEGFVAIKIYGSFNREWVKATAAEAHRLGLHVHGHLPAGMRPLDAIEDGYDEITHIYFVMMQAMPDDVVQHSNGIARVMGPAKYAKDVDLDADPMRSLIATMAQRKITVDPTLVVVENLLVPDDGELAPAYLPFAGTLPPAVERGYRQGGLALPDNYTRADVRASFAKLCALVGSLHRAAVPIVAGTDGSGMELVRELELYVAAGLTTAEALANATIAPAHLVGADAHTGVIAVGMAADLVLVDGDPSRDIGALRHTRTVMMDGKLMDAEALREAGGFAGRPRLGD